MGPFPWGTMRSSVADVLKSIKWTARPLQSQPLGPYVQGVMFKVQAIGPPPVQSLQLAHGDVVIIRQDPAVQEATKPIPVIGTEQTKTLVSAEGKYDLLQVLDPWARPQ